MKTGHRALVLVMDSAMVPEVKIVVKVAQHSTTIGLLSRQGFLPAPSSVCRLTSWRMLPQNCHRSAAHRLIVTYQMLHLPWPRARPACLNLMVQKNLSWAQPVVKIVGQGLHLCGEGMGRVELHAMPAVSVSSSYMIVLVVLCHPHTRSRYI